MVSSKTSVSFGGSRNIESDSGLSTKCSALQFVISLILPARVGPIVQKKSLNSLAITEGSFEITLFILREEGGSRFNLFGNTDRIIPQVLRALLLFLSISERKYIFFDKALSLVTMFVYLRKNLFSFTLPFMKWLRNIEFFLLTEVKMPFVIQGFFASLACFLLKRVKWCMFFYCIRDCRKAMVPAGKLTIFHFTGKLSTHRL